MPRRCAAITSPVGPAMAITGSSAMPSNTPGRSLYVRLDGPDHGPGAAGKWTDAATGEHGDLLDLIALNRDLSRLGEAMDDARSFLAVPRHAAFGRSSAAAVHGVHPARLRRIRPPAVSRRPSRSRHDGRNLSARSPHHRSARLVCLALPPVGLLPRDRARPARNLAGPSRRGDRSRRPYHRHPAHLARSAAPGKGAARRSAPRPGPSSRQRRASRHRDRHPRRRRRARNHARAQIGAAATCR